MFIYLLPYLFIYEVFCAINVLEKGITPIDNSSVGIQFFIDIENTNRRLSCRISSRTERCCLNNLGDPDCDSMHVFPDHKEHVQPRDVETLTQVYPTMYPYNQVGFCDFILDTHCGRSKKRSTQTVKIPFDTRITADSDKRGTLSKYIKISSVPDCNSLDENSFKDCSPVNCNLKYGGAKPYFDERLRKCVAAATCKGDPSKDLPDVVYEPNSNTCRDLESPLAVEDINKINTDLFLTSLPEQEYETKKIELQSNCSTISQNLQLIGDLLTGKLFICMGQDVSCYSECLRTAILNVFLMILGICAALLTFVFCMHMCVHLQENWQKGELKNSFSDYGNMFTGEKCNNDETKKSKIGFSISENRSFVNPKVKNALLRDVILKDIPMELRDSVVDVCDRMGKQVRWKKRYRSGASNQAIFAVGDEALSSHAEDELVSDDTQQLLDK